ncbi:MAG: hypothetical protein PF569_03260, partial [Candidatus Woesearchaeota archaeon]|nr:hypothetical protein [Candidatus Woesearchaeota archaeon]
MNWYLFVLTIGMIYWTKYSDCKYKLVKINQKINKKKEKILRFQKKIYKDVIQERKKRNTDQSHKKIKEN